jgi:hypothetical protein
LIEVAHCGGFGFWKVFFDVFAGEHWQECCKVVVCDGFDECGSQGAEKCFVEEFYHVSDGSCWHDIVDVGKDLGLGCLLVLVLGCVLGCVFALQFDAP